MRYDTCAEHIRVELGNEEGRSACAECRKRASSMGMARAVARVALERKRAEEDLARLREMFS